MLFFKKKNCWVHSVRIERYYLTKESVVKKILNKGISLTTDEMKMVLQRLASHGRCTFYVTLKERNKIIDLCKKYPDVLKVSDWHETRSGDDYPHRSIAT